MHKTYCINSREVGLMYKYLITTVIVWLLVQHHIHVAVLFVNDSFTSIVNQITSLPPKRHTECNDVEMKSCTNSSLFR